ncbi:MAG: hypothetical protein WCY09_08040 [Candidatus Omnitrophota bacterium]|jgi:hypothetical protein
MSIRDKVREASDRAKDRLKSIKQITSELIYGERIVKLKRQAEECKLMFTDKRYPESIEFLSEYKKRLKGHLESLSTSKDINVVEVAKAGARIGLLRDILERPDKILKDFERIKDDTE